MEKCQDHSAHVARIEAMEKRMSVHEMDSKEVRARLFDCIDDLKQNYMGEAMRRLPMPITTTITLLSSTVVGLAVYFITRR